ncbi:hypothetical protein TSUD_413830, partial [Trifolium subterraneum]
PSPNFEFPVYEAIEEEDEEIPDEIRRLLEQEKRTIQPHKEVIELINLGSEEEKKEIKIGASLEASVKEMMIVLLREYVDIFAWSYQDMPGLDPEIVEHHLPLKPECPLKTAFITPWGTFCYKVMPFGLTNAGATYQRGMTTLFHDMMHKEIEMLLSEYDIEYRTQKAIKGSILADHLAHQPVEDYQPIKFDFPDEEIMYLKMKDCDEPVFGEGPDPESQWGLIFDGAVNLYGSGIGEIIVTPKGAHIPFTARLQFECTNNIAEYEACIMGSEEAIDLRIKNIDIYGDSALVINQIKGEWETRYAGLIPYRDYARRLLTFFNKVELHHIPRDENQMADALATLSSMYRVNRRNETPTISIRCLERPAYVFATEEVVDNKPWFHDIKMFLQKQEYPPGASNKDRKTLRRLSSSFFLNDEVLYKRNFDMVLLRWCGGGGWRFCGGGEVASWCADAVVDVGGFGVGGFSCWTLFELLVVPKSAEICSFYLWVPTFCLAELFLDVDGPITFASRLGVFVL